MNGLFAYLATPSGRYMRILAGVVVVFIGSAIKTESSDTVGWIVIVVGLLPILAGTLDVCLFAPLFGHAFMGRALRAQLSPAAPALDIGDTYAEEDEHTDEDEALEAAEDDYDEEPGEEPGEEVVYEDADDEEDAAFDEDDEDDDDAP